MNKSDDLLPAAEAARFAATGPARAGAAAACTGADGASLLPGPAGRPRARERRAAGRAAWGAARVQALPGAAPLRGRCPLGRYRPARCRGPGGAAGDRAARADPDLDHRRHCPGQEGAALGGRRSPDSGRLGTTTNCQVAVSLSLANAAASLPVAWRLYLPAAWTSDRQRRLAAGVPAGVRFATKPEIALEQLGAAVARDLPRGVVLADEAYGGAVQFRDGVRDLGLDYTVAIDRAQGLLLDDSKGPLAPGRQRTFCPRRCGRPCQDTRPACAMPPCGCGQHLTAGPGPRNGSCASGAGARIAPWRSASGSQASRPRPALRNW